MKASANKAAAKPSKRQRRVAKKPADPASLVGLEDKPKAPTCAGTVEKMVSSLEAKIEVQEPKLLDIEDKPKAPPSAATGEMIVPSLDFIGLEAKIELQEPKLLDIEDKVETDTTLKVP